MPTLVELPVENGSVIVEVDEADVPSELTLASTQPGETAARLGTTLEQALEKLYPTIAALTNRLQQAGPEDIEIEFSLKVGGETGLIVAKGSVEANFTVKLSWHK